MPGNVTINLPRSPSSLAASAFSFCVAAATVSSRPGLTTASSRSLRSLGRAKARPLTKRYKSRCPMRFSQRIGLSPATKLAQRESIDDDLRSSLWSLLTLVYWNSYERPDSYDYGRSDYVKGSNIGSLITALWLHYFKKPIDTIDTYWEDCYNRLREYFFSATWYQVYDFIEFIAQYGPERKKDKFIELCNSYLERENSAYRFLNGRVTEITSEEEIHEVESALANASPYAGVKTHLESALALLSDRKSPDYRKRLPIN